MASGHFDKSCDVLIIGAGLAGGCLARQLSLQQPDLKVIVVDKKKDFDWWVGESTIEVWDDYAIRVLGLGPYLASNYIPKHGLRFFFDSEKKDLAFDEMSEIGWSRYSGMRSSFQLDRAKMDRDLVEMNRQMGVEVLMGVKVGGKSGGDGITLDRENGHLVETSAGVIKCKWLVDAGGRSSPVRDKLGLAREEMETTTGSYWGRYTGLRTIDECGSDEWRRKNNYTERFRSTTHLMYKGYWIWIIPLGPDLISLGVSFDRTIEPLVFKNGDELTKWLRTHRAVNDMFTDKSEVKDFMGLKVLGRGSHQFFSEDRWFLTGMAAGFGDPFLSLGCMILTMHNQFICKLIETERSGDKAKLENRLAHFNFMCKSMQTVVNHKFQDGRLRGFGSFDATAMWQVLGYGGYINSLLPDFCSDLKTTIGIFDSHEGKAECGCETEGENLVERLSNQYASDRLREEFVAFLEERGKFYERNERCYIELFPPENVYGKSYAATRNIEEELKISKDLYEASFRYLIHRMATIDSIPWNEDVFEKHFNPDPVAGQKLSDVLTPLREAAKAGTRSTRRSAPEGMRWTLRGLVEERELDGLHGWAYRFLGPNGEDLNRELNDE